MENNGTDTINNSNTDNKPIPSLDVILSTTNQNSFVPNSDNPDNKNQDNLDNQSNNQNNQNQNQNQEQNNDNSDNNQGTNNQVETFEQTIAKFRNESTLSTEDKEYKDLLINTFKGTAIDENGNLVDKDNVVVLSSDKLKNYLENEQLPFDAKGNVINDKGEIIKTKEQVLAENSVITPILKDIKESFGIEFPDDFKPNEDNQGIVDIVHESLKQVQRNTVYEFLNGNPEIKAFAQHLALGQIPETYTSSNVDYKNIDIKKLEETAKIDLIKKSLTAQGNPNPEQIANLLSKAGEEELNKATASAVLFLDEKQIEINNARDAQIKQQQVDSEKATIDYWDDVNTIVSKGIIGNIQLPVQSRQAFFDYMSKPVNEKGQSQEAIDSEKETIEQDLLISLLRFNKGDIGKLANQIAAQQKVNTLQERLNKLKGFSNTTGVSDKGNTNNNNANNNVSLGNLFPGDPRSKK